MRGVGRRGPARIESGRPRSLANEFASWIDGEGNRRLCASLSVFQSTFLVALIFYPNGQNLVIELLRESVSRSEVIRCFLFSVVCALPCDTFLDLNNSCVYHNLYPVT